MHAAASGLAGLITGPTFVGVKLWANGGPRTVPGTEKVHDPQAVRIFGFAGHRPAAEAAELCCSGHVNVCK